jgi:hypothetical protein
MANRQFSGGLEFLRSMVYTWVFPRVKKCFGVAAVVVMMHALLNALEVAGKKDAFRRPTESEHFTASEESSWRTVRA